MVDSFTPSEFLTARRADATALGPPKPPRVFALPGALRSVTHEELQAHQAAGREVHEIVALVNEQWRQDNAEVLSAHEQWARGPYAEGIELARKAAQQAKAEQMRRQEVMERLIREASADGGDT